MEYQHYRIGREPWSIHIVKIERSHRDFKFVSRLGQDRIFDLEQVGKQVKRLPKEYGKPLAAVNGDFFRIRPGPYRGDPLGLHITEGEVVSSPTGTSFWIDPCGVPHIDEVISHFRAKGPEGFSVAFTLNQERKDDKAVLYTPILGGSTRTASGWELILEQVGNNPWLPLRIGRSFRARIKEINEQGNTPLTPGIMVLSIGPELWKLLPKLSVGTEITLLLRTIPDLSGAQTALGGGPRLIHRGKPLRWTGNLPRHPRTVLGWNQYFFFLIVVDGRQEGLSVGMTYPELADLLLQCGCQEGMNLDGGGSSTLWLGDRVMNSPSDGRERSVGNCLIVVRKKGTGKVFEK